MSEQQPSVLVVDDVHANLVAMQALLDGMGCEPVLVKSGNDALRQLLNREFALILLDVQMPVMDGFEVARVVRCNAATREVPIIFLTAANNTEESMLRGYGSGAVDFLFKPINPNILRSKVRVFLELEEGRRQLRKANDKLARAYSDLKAAQGRLIQSAKMASLGELVAGVAHEINNPLSFVLSHLGTVQRSLNQMRTAFCAEDVEHWDRARNRLSEMTLGLERIQDLVVKLRTFSRLDEGERKRVSLRESVESILTILRHRVGDRIRVETHYQEPDSIDCFPSLMNQAIMNLIANSIDAIEGEGSISIAARPEGETHAISVRDTGKGIPDHLRDRVLEPFFTTKAVGHGTGLGLSITYAIVQKHGGTLELSPAPGGGTLAVIRIPSNQSSGT